MDMNWIKWIFFALVAASVLVWLYASFSRGGTRPGEGGTRPIWTDTFAVLATAALACVPASIVGYVCYLITGEPWGSVAFWLAAILSGGGFFFPLIWNNLFYTAVVDTGWNGTLRPFGKRWRGHWLSEGEHTLPKFVDVTSVDMKSLPGSPPITFTQPSKDKTLITCKANWSRRPFDPDAWLDAQNQDYAFDIELEKSARDFIKARTDDELTGPNSKKDEMAEVLSNALRKLAKPYAYDPSNPKSIKDRVKANVLDLLPPVQETEAAGQAKAASIANSAYLERFTTFRGELEKTTPGISEVDVLAAFERREKTRGTKQVIITGLESGSDLVKAAGATFLGGHEQRSAAEINKQGGA